MPKVVVLASEGLKPAQLVSVAAPPDPYLDVEVTPQMRKVPLERGDLQRDRQTAKDLIHRQEPIVVSQDRVHRVVRGG